MKRSILYFGFIIFFLTLVIIIFQKNQKSENRKSVSPTQGQLSDSRSKSYKPTLMKKSTSIFVPYWIDWKEDLKLQNYDRAVYFGITATKNGVLAADQGYENLETFMSKVQSKEKWLTLRMTDSETNLSILEDKSSWEKITKETINVVKKYRLDGLALDLEISTIPFDDTVERISQFVQSFYTESKTQNIPFSLILYGDVFFRKRPFDLKNLTKNTDEIFIMAYDFHKSRGEPGPNFPLYGQEKYGYDLQTMINDFKTYMSPEKLTVIFGMYGYDWFVNEKKQPIRPAKALTLNEIKKNFLNNCQLSNCVIKRNEISSETEVNYVDADQGLHIVWFEDQESAGKKTEHLLKQEVGKVAYWAEGYF